MQYLAVTLAISAIATMIICISADGECIYMKDVTMHLNGDDATFELNYSLDRKSVV